MEFQGLMLLCLEKYCYHSLDRATTIMSGTENLRRGFYCHGVLLSVTFEDFFAVVVGLFKLENNCLS